MIRVQISYCLFLILPLSINSFGVPLIRHAAQLSKSSSSSSTPYISNCKQHQQLDSYRQSENGSETELELLVENEDEYEYEEDEHEDEDEVEEIVDLINSEQKLVIDKQLEEDANYEEEIETNTVSAAEQEQLLKDESYMRLAIEHAKAQEKSDYAYPNPMVGAALISADGATMALGRSTYDKDAIQDVLEQVGLEISPLREWCVTWPLLSSACWKLREDLSSATLYVTLEPVSQRKGETLPPLTQLIELSGLPRIVIGAPDPVPEKSGKGAQALHRALGLDVSMGRTLTEECLELITPYIERVNSKFHKMARNHRQRYGRPLGMLHCSVIDSENVEAFAALGNTFGTSFGGKTLSFRDFGSYEMAPPPEQIWSSNDDDKEFMDDNEDEEQIRMSESVLMPWYEQVDAVIATFPRSGNGPTDENNTIKSRLNGLKWLSTFGKKLPVGVERILVLDATDLESLPISNDDPNLPPDVDVEEFWSAVGRKATRVILRKGRSTQAEGAAEAAALAAEAASKAAMVAKMAIETGEAENAAEAAMEYHSAALAAMEMIQTELSKTLERKQKLQSFGVVVETLNGRDPIDVMKHLGKRNGYGSVVWRAGCWGQRGVQSIIDGGFQCVSAHLAVDAKGGKFWQQMLAERAIQGACGPESHVKVFSRDEDISLEFCDSNDADRDCVLTKEGKPIRHVRLDCRVALYDKDRRREFVIAPTRRIDRKVIQEEAPWFL